jgi:hypothetical protein
VIGGVLIAFNGRKIEDAKKISKEAVAKGAQKEGSGTIGSTEEGVRSMSEKE